MKSINEIIKEYTVQLNQIEIQRAYQAIILYILQLRRFLQKEYPNNVFSSLYYGYLDMTYFAMTPTDLKLRNLKIAIVYVHHENRFDVWLCANNRSKQKEYIQLFENMDFKPYKISKMGIGIDSILEHIIIEQPNFDNPSGLNQIVMKETSLFIEQCLAHLE